ncbi:DnaJ-domain-containing protein [Hysterangium stoloniferum]|nr:DnaJ-domain-containing protein [Hysterangium stoloniferum]
MASKDQDEDVNAYEILDIKIEATETEIKKAYRQRSLKVHPDRHPNNPDAAKLFHELNQAYELLLDVTRRAALDAKLRKKIAQKARYEKFDIKRKGMQAELDEAERAAKRSKQDKGKKERERREEAERIQEEGRRMREDRENALKEKEIEKKTKEKEAAKAFELESLGPLDTTVRVKYPLSKYPSLITPASLAILFSAYGTIDEATIVLSMKPSKKAPNKPPKFATALIHFAKLGEAHAAVCASGLESKGLKDVEVSWAGGQEPAVLANFKQKSQVNHASMREADLPPPTASATTTFAGNSSSFAPSFVSFPFISTLFLQTATVPTPAPGLDYESITLMRLRQAERDRLEREIREQEAMN